MQWRSGILEQKETVLLRRKKRGRSSQKVSKALLDKGLRTISSESLGNKYAAMQKGKC
jgi:hypothetical protein